MDKKAAAIAEYESKLRPMHQDTPNVELIRFHGTRVINAPVFAQVRAELRLAVKAGRLGHLKRDGLKPEIFFHPDHKNGAIERQKREAEYSVKCIASVMVSPAQFRDGITAMGGDVEQELLSRASRPLPA